MKAEKTEVLREFRTLPGVGKSIAEDLWNLGLRSKAELASKDPEILYEDLCRQQGVRVDRCMLYVFRCAVYIAGSEDPDPEKRKWWNWKDSVLSR
ncbi:pathogenicity locus [Leptospira wolffii]|uniref:helix-hairpin-helix domain-containing protein n=1 Tax=Leptospira wolffii TaxID=409998 RepID=UPI00034BDBAE|nr:helix-hairpin-helix domain-containing protein [Leptospira wolffii]TGK62354.1 pathogenicity locus [Leptospira wolffii]TGK68129.1 pathogenicity locus [Leptospira wolffii]TGK74262.1 pathogenicity locus [Leptospira wolffii]TGL32163.1 pathogenicity locus [Leptospira wolffii]